MACETKQLGVNGSAGSDWDTAGCQTQTQGDSSYVQCSCSKTGLVAVLPARPPSTAASASGAPATMDEPLRHQCFN